MWVVVINPTVGVKKSKRTFPAQKDLKAFDKIAKKAPQVRVGFPATELGSVRYPDGTPVISVAFWNEFGTEKKGKEHIPERAFLRKTLIENRSAYRRKLRRIAVNAIKGRQDLLKGSRNLGFEAVDDVQSMIESLKSPRNADSTLAAKKPKANPLVNTGFMRSSVTFELRTGRNGKTKKD